MKSSKFIIAYLIFFLFSCNQNYVKSIYPIPSKKLFKKQLYYEVKYGYISTLADTTIKDAELCRVYRRGALNKIGKVDDGNPVGYWFIFKDSLELEYILRYDINKIDSFYHPFSIVNQSW
jgi:hypothetical protein